MKSCTEIARLIDEREMDGLPLLKNVRLKLHFIVCSGCKKYNLFSKKLHTILISTTAFEPATLTAEEKEKLRNHLG
jgi:hypothetical protein